MTRVHDDLAARHRAGHARPLDDLLSDERFADAARTARAAVLIAVTEEAEPRVVLTKRPRTMRDHPGQVAFPGGKCDDGENAVETALREAEEELNLSPNAVNVIGPTDRYQTGTGFDITPVLATVSADFQLEPDPREVESWFACPLARLLDRRHWRRGEVFWRGAMRTYYEQDFAGYRIWGVTAAICINLSRRLDWPQTGG